MVTRYRLASAVSSAPAVVSIVQQEPPPLDTTTNLACSLADTSISVNVSVAASSVSEDVFCSVPSTFTTDLYRDYRPGSPSVNPTLDTPTITRILLSTLEGVQCGVPTLTTPTLTPTTLRNIQQTFLQVSASQVHPPETHTNQAGFVPPFVHPQPGNTFISIDNKSLGGGIATLVDTSARTVSELGHTLAKDGFSLGGPPPLLPISTAFTSSSNIFTSSSNVFTSSSNAFTSTASDILNNNSINTANNTYINISNNSVSALNNLPSQASIVINCNNNSNSALNQAPSIIVTSEPLTTVTGLPGPSRSPPLHLPVTDTTATEQPPAASSPMPSVSFYSSDSDTMHSMDLPPRPSGRRTGGRRPNNSEKLSYEEEQKRSVRRERNKMAAARCRKRRLDQTMTLQEETDHLDEKKTALQKEIHVLTQQKEELDFLLTTHKAVCTRPSRTKSTTAPTVIVTSSSMRQAPTATIVNVSLHQQQQPTHAVSEESDMLGINVKEENFSDSDENYGNSLFGSIISNNNNNSLQTNKSHPPGLRLVSTTASNFVPSTSSFSFSSNNRDRLTAPSTSIGTKPNRPTSLAVAPLTDIGVSIETPSSGLRGLNFESMMDGGTGLTPVTPLTGVMCSISTGLTPLTTPIMAHPSASVASTSSANCGYQQRSSSSELSSPDSMSSKHLVSL